MRNSDWLKIKLRLICLICVQTQMLCNGAINTHTNTPTHPHTNTHTHTHTHTRTHAHTHTYTHTHTHTHTHAQLLAHTHTRAHPSAAPPMTRSVWTARTQTHRGDYMYTCTHINHISSHLVRVQKYFLH